MTRTSIKIADLDRLNRELNAFAEVIFGKGYWVEIDKFSIENFDNEWEMLPHVRMGTTLETTLCEFTAFGFNEVFPAGTEFSYEGYVAYLKGEIAARFRAVAGF